MFKAGASPAFLVLLVDDRRAQKLPATAAGLLSYFELNSPLRVGAETCSFDVALHRCASMLRFDTAL
jgi:hypothetical protein